MRLYSYFLDFEGEISKTALCERSKSVVETISIFLESFGFFIDFLSEEESKVSSRDLLEATGL